MKRIFLFAGMAAILTLASCKKDWVCQCTDQNNNNTYIDIPNAAVDDARQTCNSNDFNDGTNFMNCSLIE